MKSFIYLLCTIALLSCARKPSDTTLGPATDEFAIEAAQRKALDKLDPYTIQLGQKVHYIETQEVVSSGGSNKLLSKEWFTEVTELENNDDERIITTIKKVTDKLYDPEFVYEFKSVFFLPQLSLSEASDPDGEDGLKLKNVVERLKSNETTKATDITGVAYHNLKAKEVLLNPPERVEKAENCKDIEGCKIKADLITYDIIFQMRNGETQKFRVEWYTSPEVPFFAALLKNCTTTLIPIDNLRVLVKQCREVVDFDQ